MRWLPHSAGSSPTQGFELDWRRRLQPGQRRVSDPTRQIRRLQSALESIVKGTGPGGRKGGKGKRGGKGVQAGVESLETRARLTGGSSSDAIYRMVGDAVRSRGIRGARLVDVGCGSGRPVAVPSAPVFELLRHRCRMRTTASLRRETFDKQISIARTGR